MQGPQNLEIRYAFDGDTWSTHVSQDGDRNKTDFDLFMIYIYIYTFIYIYIYIRVSINGGIPKSSILFSDCP